jgi:hypothetical protein
MASDDNCAAHDGRRHLPHMSIGIPKGSQIKTAVQERNDHNGRQRNPTALRPQQRHDVLTGNLLRCPERVAKPAGTR